MKTLLLLALLAAGADAGEKVAPGTEGEMETAHDGSYAYMGAGVEFTRPKLCLFARGYRLTEDGYAKHQVHLGIGRLVSLAQNRVNLTPGVAFMAGEARLRGIALTLDAEARLMGLLVSASFTQTNPISEDGRAELWLYPLTVEKKVSRNWGVAGVLETLWTEHGAANEYGFRIIHYDRFGQWFVGYMTTIQAEHGRDHHLRFGRIFFLKHD